MSGLLQPGSVFAGEFRIVRPLDAGGMGSVYVAEQLGTGNQRALKLMLPSLVSDAKLRERFSLEARIGARIASDHVVQVVAAGIEPRDEIPWLAMELLVGEELEQRVDREGPLPPSVALEIARQLCHALSAAHAANVVHRDLKPKNLFLSKSRLAGAPFLLKVLDFGIAKVVAEAISTGTAGMGTPLWMAPEQTEISSHVGPETDIWAVGLIVYWMLTGKSYWRGAEKGATNIQVILRELVMDPIVPASVRAAEQRVAHRLPPMFDGWFARCIERSRGARFRSAALALAELERAMSDTDPTERAREAHGGGDFATRPTYDNLSTDVSAPPIHRQATPAAAPLSAGYSAQGNAAQGNAAQGNAAQIEAAQIKAAPTNAATPFVARPQPPQSSHPHPSMGQSVGAPYAHPSGYGPPATPPMAPAMTPAAAPGRASFAQTAQPAPSVGYAAPPARMPKTASSQRGLWLALGAIALLGLLVTITYFATRSSSPRIDRSMGRSSDPDEPTPPPPPKRTKADECALLQPIYKSFQIPTPGPAAAMRAAEDAAKKIDDLKVTSPDLTKPTAALSGSLRSYAKLLAKGVDAEAEGRELGVGDVRDLAMSMNFMTGNIESLRLACGWPSPLFPPSPGNDDFPGK